MIVYGMNGFVQELQQTLKANGILEQSEHFQSLGAHLKEGEVYSFDVPIPSCTSHTFFTVGHVIRQPRCSKFCDIAGHTV